MDLAVAYIVFNRPHHTRETFAAIRAQRPARLFIIADGPRPGHPTDRERCAEVRDIVSRVDWPCTVRHNFADVNMGLKNRVSSGLDWVFSEVEAALVLEDDCLPHPDFFRFCAALLERYHDCEQVWVVTGDNFQNGQQRGDASYYFSRYNHCWGWATWRRAWHAYQGDIPFWPKWSTSQDWLDKLPDRRERQYWEKIFDRVWRGKLNSWAYPWTACVWYHGGLTVTPNVNLVTNIGLGPEGTHTVARNNEDGRPRFALGPLTHPETIEQNLDADRYTFASWFDRPEERGIRRGLLLLRYILARAARTIRGS